MKATHYTEMESPLGPLCLCGTEHGLAGLFMEEHRHGPAEALRHGWRRDDRLYADARAQLAEYFHGGRREFAVQLDRAAIGGTAFQQRVWTALEAIPYGVTISYGELARRIEQPAAVRAVGLANGRNPLSIIVPCHRVIGAKGTLTGYGGGMERKRVLLDLEGAEVDPSMKESPAPIHARALPGSCPVCGQPNGCRMESGETYKGACWCERLELPAAARQRLEEEIFEQRCVCRSCLTALQAEPGIAWHELARRSEAQSRTA